MQLLSTNGSRASKCPRLSEARHPSMVQLQPPYRGWLEQNQSLHAGAAFSTPHDKVCRVFKAARCSVICCRSSSRLAQKAWVSPGDRQGWWCCGYVAGNGAVLAVLQQGAGRRGSNVSCCCGWAARRLKGVQPWGVVHGAAASKGHSSGCYQQACRHVQHTQRNTSRNYCQCQESWLKASWGGQAGNLSQTAACTATAPSGPSAC